MTFEEALLDIRSHEFAARVGVASALRTFLRAARKQESVQTILYEMASGEAREQSRQHVLLEVLRLSRLQVDFRYQNPWDSALAVLLWALSGLDRPLAGLAAEAVMKKAPQCWWALRVAENVLQKSPEHDTRATEQSSDAMFAHVRFHTGTQNLKTGESVLQSSFVFTVAPCPRIHVYRSTQIKLLQDEQAPLAFLPFLQAQPEFMVDLKNPAAAAPQQPQRILQ